MPVYWRAKLPKATINCFMALRLIKASIGERSKPPIGGMTFLNMFRYGSVIENKFVRIGLLVSRFGNHVSKILIISKKL